MEFTYHIEGTHCANCIEKIKKALSSQYKIIEITLDPPLLKIASDSAPSLMQLNESILSAGKYSLHPINETSSLQDPSETKLSSYYPIFLIAIYILGVAFINNFHNYDVNWYGLMNQFMAGFFLVFSAFKLLDIQSFAQAYSTYDLLAQRWYFYGFLYPFIELILGILYLTEWFPFWTQIATIIIMGFSSLGVIKSLIKKQKFQCACLGTIINVPLSVITLIEDLAMVVLAIIALFMV